MTVTILLLGALVFQFVYQITGDGTMNIYFTLAFVLTLYAWIKDYVENYVGAVDDANI